MLCLSAEKGRLQEETLFCRTRDKVAEIWEGARLGQRGAVRVLGLAQAKPFASYEQALQECLQEQSKIYISRKADEKFLLAVFGRWTAVPDKRAFDIEKSSMLGDWRPMLGELRLYKSPAEIAAIRSAAKITAKAVSEAARQVSAACGEADVAALLSARYISAGCRHAFKPIVAGGANACTLHYCANNKRLPAGKLVLIDTGCEYGGYASDITRTFPVDGRFTAAQQDLYSVVLEAQLAALAKIRPGNTVHDAQVVAQHILAAGLRRMGILSGTPAQQIKSGRLGKYYMHKIGHWIGLDVHDVGSYNDAAGAPRLLENGMCLTLEPGLYLNKSKHVPAELHGTGVRIEDTVAIVRNKTEVLTGSAPKSVAEIEAAMAA